MKSSIDIIDALSKHFDGANDLTIARNTGISQSAISLVARSDKTLSNNCSCNACSEIIALANIAVANYA